MATNHRRHRAPLARAWRFGLFAAACWFAPQAAWAHLATTRFGEFYSGALHPLTALLHLLPWLALAMWSGQQRPGAARVGLLVFPAAALLGALLGSLHPPPAWVEPVNLASFVALGGAVVAALRLPPTLFTLPVAGMGLSHGLANGAGDLHGAPLWLYLAGLASAAYAIYALVAAGTQVLAQRQWGSIAVRAAGSWIVAIGGVYGSYWLLGPAGA